MSAAKPAPDAFARDRLDLIRYTSQLGLDVDRLSAVGPVQTFAQTRTASRMSLRDGLSDAAIDERHAVHHSRDHPIRARYLSAVNGSGNHRVRAHHVVVLVLDDVAVVNVVLRCRDSCG